MTDFTKIMRERMDDENALLQHHRDIEGYRRQAEMQTYKQQARGEKDKLLWEEAGEILKNRQEEKERIQERLQKLENEIKEGKLKHDGAVERVGNIFGSTVKWVLKIGGVAAGLVVGAGGTVATAGTAAPGAVAGGAGLAALLNVLGEAAGEGIPQLQKIGLPVKTTK
jgi:hypothetical protein